MAGVKDAQYVTAATDDGLGGTADSAALLDDLPVTVRFEIEPVRRFLSSALGEYQKCLDSRDADGVPSHLPRASGLLFGQVGGAEIVISDVEFVPNVRDSDESVMAEFEATIAPQFGDVYKNPGRGFWSDEQGVLQAIRQQSANGLELLGSIHSHPNWHEIGPPHERRQRLSEHPTQMDEYLFRQSCWPVNVIWYVHESSGGIAHRVAAWRPGAEQCDRLDIRIPAAIHEQFEVLLEEE
uniref:JAMM metalloprotease n=1 Tax=Actinoplanes tsinanensis TaxID=2039464 RepID=A0A290YXJ0_9ACTN|nr:JAMM metalloprotease [Actinoplanes tsinanensis]AVL27078.1 metal-dependent protease [Actinoplanes tsinanensis]